MARTGTDVGKCQECGGDIDWVEGDGWYEEECLSCGYFDEWCEEDDDDWEEW